MASIQYGYFHSVQPAASKVDLRAKRAAALGAGGQYLRSTDLHFTALQVLSVLVVIRLDGQGVVG